MAEGIQFKKTSKQGILDLWEVELKNFTGELKCSLPGLEFLVPPYFVHEISKNQKTHKVTPQTILVFNGSESHTETFVNSNASLKSLVISPQYISDFCEPLAIKPQEIEFNSCELAKNPQLENQIKMLADLSDSSLNPSSFSLDCVTSEVLLTTLIKQKHSHSEKVLSDVGSGYFPGAMPRVKSVLMQNIENPQFNLDLLAQESGLSKFHLIREFKKHAGISPAKYLNQFKIDLAKHWLLKSKKSVLSIAMDLGFSDLSTFNKAFKKAIGVSPRGFRLR